MVQVPPQPASPDAARPDGPASAVRARAGPRQARARATRETIVAAAAHEFAAQGYQGASLSKILERSGVTKGALHFHFASKEAMARAVAEVMERRFPEFLQVFTDRGEDVLTTAVHLAIGIADLLGDDVYCRAGMRVVSEGALGPELTPWPYRYWEDVFIDLLARAREEGSLREDVDSRELARTVVALGHGHRVVSTATAGLADLRERAVASWELILGCVAAPSWLTTWDAAGGMAGVPVGLTAPAQDGGG
jgi:AcrR family transcriptional regulator